MKRTANKTKSISKTKTVVKELKKPKNSSDHILTVTWTATEPGPRKRWWWYLGFCIVMLWLLLVPIALHDWLLMILLIVATVAMVITYSRKPQEFKYHLTDKLLTTNTKVLPIDKFRAFTVEHDNFSKNNTQSAVIILISKHRLDIPLQVFLPADKIESDKVLDALNKILPFDEAKNYLASNRFIDRIAHWFRLN